MKSKFDNCTIWWASILASRKHGKHGSPAASLHQ
jgi:hypothetical protein